MAKIPAEEDVDTLEPWQAFLGFEMGKRPGWA
jgi:hypothetical protein